MRQTTDEPQCPECETSLEREGVLSLGKNYGSCPDCGKRYEVECEGDLVLGRWQQRWYVQPVGSES